MMLQRLQGPAGYWRWHGEEGGRRINREKIGLRRRHRRFCANARFSTPPLPEYCVNYFFTVLCRVKPVILGTIFRDGGFCNLSIIPFINGILYRFRRQSEKFIDSIQ